MKIIALWTLLMFLVSMGSAEAKKPPKRGGTFVATAYSVEGETASGRMAKPGVVAADPDVLPLGTRIRVTGAGQYSGVYTVSDTGRKIAGREIDIYLRGDAEAKKFGKKQVTVQVLSEP